MRNILEKAVILSVVLWGTAVLNAGPTTVKATIDSTTMVMGNKTAVRVTVVKDKSASGSLVLPQDSLVKNVELAGEPKMTKSDIGNGREQVEYEVPVQSFDPGVYSIPGLKYAIGKDTVASNTLSLKVLDVDVSELEKNGLYDYKELEQPESAFWDFLPEADQLAWLWWTLGILSALALAWLGWYMYRRWKAGKPVLPFIPQKPVLPPYEEAVQALAVLRRQNLWERGDVKAYYTQLTDIVRRYISRRYEIGTMEMTSTQIMKAVGQIDGVVEKDALQGLLETADFVKFAKMSPLADENERSYAQAAAFVEENKPVVAVPENEKAGEDTTEKEPRDSSGKTDGGKVE